ncbi:hypothetical protein [Rubritalea halochordaticola]|uniref:hypothetical protein n=1 Tax=Rubritalea halochordaticola TaxID=714537 RepID=UPI0031FE31A5
MKFILRRRWLRRLICVLVLGPFVLFLLSNILLNSQWGRDKIASKLEQRTGYAWKIETANWTPDGKVHVYDAVADLDGGIMRVAQVDITPNVDEVVDGRLVFEELSIRQPELDVSVQWLREQVEKRARDTSSVKPQENVEPRPPVQPRPPVVVAPPVKPTPVDKEGADQREAGKVVPPAQPSQKPEGKPKSVRVQPTPIIRVFPEAWVVVEGAKITLRDGEKVLLESGPINAKIPLGGDGKQGFVRCEMAKLFDREYQTKIDVPLVWKKDRMVINGEDLTFLGVHCRSQGEIKRVGQEFVMMMKLVIPDQEWTYDEELEGVHFTGNAKHLAGTAILEGRLLKPVQWRGLCKIIARETELQEHHRNSVAHFDHLLLESALMHGRLQIYQLEAVSDEVALLGNGVLQMDGYMYGVMRLLTSPGKAAWVDSLSEGAKLFPNKHYGVMTWFQNRDRKHVDVQVDGMLWQPLVRIENICEWEPLMPRIKRLVDFVHDEHLEDLGPKISTKSQK